MSIAGVTSSRFIRAVCCVIGLSMTGCTLNPGDGHELASAIKEHYAAHATEERGACRSPRIDTIQEHRRLETSVDGEDVIMVRYTYFDPSADMDADWSKLVYLSQPCGGIAERQFVLARDDLGYRVTDMSGEHHGQGAKR